VLRLSFPCASGTKVGDLTDDASQGPEAIRMQIEQSGEAGLIPLEPQGTPARTKRSASCRQRGSTRAKPRRGCSPAAAPSRATTRSRSCWCARSAPSRRCTISTTRSTSAIRAWFRLACA